jgi:5-methylcytosine-specific restriction protein A
MLIPKLNHSGRDREFKLYNSYEISLICKGWLFSDVDHRQLDKDILGLDPNKSKGFQSMGVLHCLGLKKEFKSIFKDQDLSTAVDNLKSNSQDFNLIIKLLEYSPEFSEIINTDSHKIENSQNDSSENRKNRLKNNLTKPKKQKSYVYTYTRNPDVVAEALYRANGACESCSKKAPFNRKSNGTPYLEVHHIKPLSEQDTTEENLDVLDNVLALCPNCHRKMHFG